MSGFLRGAADVANDRFEVAISGWSPPKPPPPTREPTALELALARMEKAKTVAEIVALGRAGGLTDEQILGMGRNRKDRRLIEKRLRQAKR